MHNIQNGFSTLTFYISALGITRYYANRCSTRNKSHQLFIFRAYAVYICARVYSIHK